MKLCCCTGCGFNVMPFSENVWGVAKFCIIKGLLEPITVVIADDNGILPRELSARSRGEGIANVLDEFCSLPKSKRKYCNYHSVIKSFASLKGYRQHLLRNTPL